MEIARAWEDFARTRSLTCCGTFAEDLEIHGLLGESEIVVHEVHKGDGLFVEVYGTAIHATIPRPSDLGLRLIRADGHRTKSGGLGEQAIESGRPHLRYFLPGGGRRF